MNLSLSLSFAPLIDHYWTIVESGIKKEREKPMECEMEWRRNFLKDPKYLGSNISSNIWEEEMKNGKWSFIAFKNIWNIQSKFFFTL